MFGPPDEHHLAVATVDAATVWTGEEALLFGGRNASGPHEIIQAFDPSTGEAKVLPARLPNETQAAAAVWTGSKAYVLGGAGLLASPDQADGDAGTLTRREVEPHDQILRYDPSTGQLDRVEASLPDEVLGLSAVWIEGAAYIVGGANRSTTDGTMETHSKDWILRFDPDAEDPLERIGTFPVPIRDASAVAYRGDVYVFGGLVERGSGDHRILEPTDAIYRYDPETGDVDTVNVTLATPMRWFSAARVGDRAYLFGGCADDCEQPDREALVLVQRFNFTTGGLAVLEARMTWGAAVASMSFFDGSSAWVLGGGQGPERYDTVFDNATRFLLPPSAPRTLSAEPHERGVIVTWDEPSFAGSGVTSYAIERARSGAAHERIATVEARHTGFLDREAEAGVNYTYRARALGPGGESKPTPEDQVRAPAQPPSAPPRLEAYGLPDRILLRWAAPEEAGGAPVDGYRVYRNGSLLRATTNLSLEDTSVEANVTYMYAVSAVNAEGESRARGPVEASTADRLPPARHVQTSVRNGSVELSWLPPGDEQPDRYRVLRGPVWHDLTPLANTSIERYVDETVDPGAAYWYAVAAVDGAQLGVPSKPQRVALLEPPGPPSGFSLKATPGQVTVFWDPPVEEGGAEELTYRVIRRGPARSEQVLTPDAWRETSWIDRTVENGETYNYTVRAVSDAGAGPETTPLRITVPLADTPPHAKIEASEREAEVGTQVTFDATASRDEKGSIVQAMFRFGDGTATGWQSDLVVNHTYEEPGTYGASVQVRDERGNVSELALVTVTVTAGSTQPAAEETDGTGDPGGDDALFDPLGLGLPALGIGLALAVVVAVGLVLWARGRSRREDGGGSP